MSRSRNSRRAKLRIGLIVVLVIANACVAYVVLKINAVEEAIAETVVTIPNVAPVLDVPPASSDESMTVLLIGSDSRENLPDDWAPEFGSFAGARADAIMLVQVSPATGEISIVSIPRDLLVQIEGFGQQKINAAYAFGGASLMISTLKDTFNIAIHHYVEVDFVGFAGLVDEIGGIPANFAYPSKDLKSGLLVEAGPQVLDGRTALAYARSRSFQEFRDGQWRNADANDIGRTGRQQELVIGMLEALKSPATLSDAEELVSSVGAHVAVDAGLLERDLLALAFDFRSISSESLSGATLPTTSQIVDGVWYEIAVEPDASLLIDKLSASLQESVTDLALTSSSLGIDEVGVAIINGGGISGAAFQIADILSAEGFQIDNVDNADTFDVETGLITVPAGGESIGALLVQTLGWGTVVIDSAATNVTVLVGKDFGAP